jgi:hypothetical protein
MCRLQTTRGKGETRTRTEPVLYGSVVKVLEFGCTWYTKLDRASRRSFEDHAARCPEHRLPLHTVGAFARRLSLPVAHWRLRSVRFTGRKTWSPATPVAAVHSSVATMTQVGIRVVRTRLCLPTRSTMQFPTRPPTDFALFPRAIPAANSGASKPLSAASAASLRIADMPMMINDEPIVEWDLGMSVAGTNSSQVRVYALAKV